MKRVSPALFALSKLYMPVRCTGDTVLFFCHILARYFCGSPDVILRLAELDGYIGEPVANRFLQICFSSCVRVEGFVEFEYEITQLTVRHAGGTSFCEPIGHIQVNGDYRQSWQPQVMTEQALSSARDIAAKVTGALGGRGIFGVELFIRGDEVIFSEVSPRPHDTGMVTMISQDLSQFALHARAILGLPIPNIHQHGPSASSVILVEGTSKQVCFEKLDDVLSEPDTQLRLFGKPGVNGLRRMGVVLARGSSIDDALQKARHGSEAVVIKL